jgi:tRNA(Arg) A34 adenosine deaminase TadA
MLKLLQMAAGVALPTTEKDARHFFLGAVGIRNDGTMVASRNGASALSGDTATFQIQPNSHAEGRCLRKLGKYGVMYVARVSREDGSLKLSKPCQICQVRLKAAQVEKVYFTVSDNEYGLWLPKKDQFTYFMD